VVADLSFISLRKVLSVLRDILRPGGDLVALVKPQFEAGRAKVGKGGVVRDPAVHREVLREVLREGRKLGLVLRGLAPSRPPGADGNREYFAWWSSGGKGGIPDGEWEELIREAVEDSLQEERAGGDPGRPREREGAEPSS
jgi:23S rRNA (cytidine1920-2'-O)/16S rRNA (cytidine1409-2'-O)-methyltransferase